MPIPSSGALSLSTIQTEFGGTNPISLSEYYAGGGRVPSGTSGTNGAVPSSGAISMSRFYGTSALSVSIDDQNVAGFAFIPAEANASYTLQSNGNVVVGNNISGPTIAETWLDAGAASSFEVRATRTGGSVDPVGSPLNTWLNLGTNRSWGLSTITGLFDAILLIEIRAVGGSVIDSAVVRLEVSSEGNL